jgi:hypothetical protein
MRCQAREDEFEGPLPIGGFMFQIDRGQVIAVERPNIRAEINTGRRPTDDEIPF